MMNIKNITLSIFFMSVCVQLSWGQRNTGKPVEGVNRGQTTSNCMNIDFGDAFFNWNLTYYSGVYGDTSNHIAGMYGETPDDNAETNGRFTWMDNNYFNTTEKNEWLLEGVDLGDLPIEAGAVVRLGGKLNPGVGGTTGGKKERMSRMFTVEENKTMIGFYYAYVFFHDGSDWGSPEFEIKVNLAGAQDIKTVGYYTIGISGDAIANEDYLGGYIPWQKVMIDLSDYVGQDVIITIENSDGQMNGPHSANTYFTGFCSDETYEIQDFYYCYGLNTMHSIQLENMCGTGDYREYCTIYANGVTILPIGDPDNNKVQFYVSQTASNKYIELVSTFSGTKITYRYNLKLANDCAYDSVIPCPVFTLKNKEVYHLSFWVKNEDKKFAGKGDGAIYVDLSGQDYYSFGPFKVDDSLYGQWQKVEGSFEVPNYVWNTKLKLVNLGGGTTHIDDIRLIPNNANALTYIYDPVSKRLIAELDDNNFATFYEYDEEGNLTRIKKETQRGIKTLKESRRELLKPIKSNTINPNDGDIKFNNLD
jgi:hypothetical protein